MSPRNPARALMILGPLHALFCSSALAALNPSLDVSQCGHTSWTFRNGFLNGAPAGQRLLDKHIYDQTMTAGSADHRVVTTNSTPRQFQKIPVQGAPGRSTDLRFGHLTTNDGLSESAVTAILQDRQGFMWFGTRDGLNRYDGNAFVVYKNKANDPESLSANRIEDLIEDDQGYLWIATYTGGVNKFDPTTERFTRYRHDPTNPNSLVADSVNSIARDGRGFLWFGTEASGLDKFEPSTGAFTHHLNDNDGQFVGRITKVIESREGDIWFVGTRGLFHLNPQTGQITRARAAGNDLGADYVYEDEVGNLWMLAYSPIVGLIKYDRQTERLMKYPAGPSAVGEVSSKLFADGQKGFWVPSSLGLYYFDRQTEQLTLLFQHVDSDPDGLNDNAVVSIYKDRGGVLWVGTENGGLNNLNFRQQQFGRYAHRPGDPNSLSRGAVTSIYRDSQGILWIGFTPRALDRLDRKTGRVTHYLASPNDGSEGTNINSMFKDARGYLWLGGWGSGLDRLDERTGQFKHYRHNADDPNSLPSNQVLRIYGDRSGQIWVGHIDGIARLDPTTEQFTVYHPDARTLTAYGNAALAFYQDRSGVLWVARGEGVLSRYDDGTKTFVNYTPDPTDPHKLNGGDIPAILEDRTGTLWLGGADGLYRFDRQNERFTRYTDSQGLPNSTIQGILEDEAGRLWISTKNGISRFDPLTETFKNYDNSDGLQANEFSSGSYTQGPDGEMFFGGSNGFNAFLPENVQDDLYVTPVAIASFKIFNKPVPIGGGSVLTKAIQYVDSLTLSYRDTVFTFEFAALSYASSHKHRYRYKLENFERGWNETSSKQPLATYTNLDPGKYVFRVQASNGDGVWNQDGVSLPILITPPLWMTNGFRVTCAAVLLALLWMAYQLRVRHLHHQFEITLDARVDERTRIARELHDTLLQSFNGLLLRFRTVHALFSRSPDEARTILENAIDEARRALTEGRQAVQGLRSSTVETHEFSEAIKTLTEELAKDPTHSGGAEVRMNVEGTPRTLRPLLRDEIYRIASEALRNAFRHAEARRIELQLCYDEKSFELRVRDDGKGIDPKFLTDEEPAGHFGLRGMRERAEQIGGKLTVWSAPASGTELVLSVSGAIAYDTAEKAKRSWLARSLTARPRTPQS